MAASQIQRPVPIDTLRTGSAYTIAQAARLAGTNPATVRNWIEGYEAPGHRMEPVFGDPETVPDGERRHVSFLQLSEIIVVASFRKPFSWHQAATLERMRHAHKFARKQWPELRFPFASNEFQRHGALMLHRFSDESPGPGVLAIDRGGQYAFPELVKETISLFEFDEHYALRYFPEGRDEPIVIDPAVGAGRPVILGTSVSVRLIQRRLEAEQSISEIANDFEISVDKVRAAQRSRVA